MRGTKDMALVERPPLDAKVIEQVLLGGDLSKLSPEQRISYYNRTCDSLGLNPLTKPFAYLSLNGKMVLYALKDCTEQLRKLHEISVTIKAREVVEGCYVVTANARMASGREDEAIGAVPIDGLKGEARSNSMMKAETKAKRRVTLSICGLGMLDETEVDSIPSAAVVVNGGSHYGHGPAPDGYAAWWAVLEGIAQTGEAPLAEAWAKPNGKAFRQHVAKVAASAWEDLKATARAVDAAKTKKLTGVAS